ncbi:hypothetical protein LTR91_000875 [Friedmanniomyces endolithicus]|uniref:DUF7918 domain-containing protein n=1 Tax=Friedmanniomyces endolithicus TaxID=329885 RepID=A0AAN6L266_9PEZI|nr:hypothetical protein LTR38_008365 [Friedmanniomyces endolithicus]KAK0803193.1 hypothetical protein LTR59_004756 [Friedmanniomyces endolithicus]KAK0810765.1 hypothetical protein LTR75_005493 [Friedmanniomyces endolithicus]KAK0849635.1 hypothetical protein LTR03_005053 [Friedmanniomyces endolithicus]KAK0871333.1 hypothetical protein LTS02_001977 [Friedmanniomyces endolithicus]
MAIHPRLPGMIVRVSVDDKHADDEHGLPEYDEDEAEVDSHDPTACVKYIEAISGARFYIDYSFNRRIFRHANNNIEVDVELDCGAGCAEFSRPRDIYDPAWKSLEWAARDTHNGRIKQSMLFSELIISEDVAPDKALIGKLAELGTIKVKVYKVDLEPPRAKKSSRHGKGKVHHSSSRLEGGSRPLAPDGRISEKLLKGRALTHQARYANGKTGCFQD